VQLDDTFRRKAGGAMKVIDILGYHMRELAHQGKPRNRLMSAAGLGIAERVADDEIAPPGFHPPFLGSEVVGKLDRLEPCPEAAWRAEIGNAAFRRDARTGKRDYARRALDHAGELVYLILGNVIRHRSRHEVPPYHDQSLGPRSVARFLRQQARLCRTAPFQE
jgi:hypothetical protein